MGWISQKTLPGQGLGPGLDGRVAGVFDEAPLHLATDCPPPDPALAELNNDPVIVLALPICTTGVLCVLGRPMIDYCGYVVPTLVDGPGVTGTWNGSKARRHLYQMCAAVLRDNLLTAAIYRDEINTSLATIAREGPCTDCRFFDPHFIARHCLEPVTPEHHLFHTVHHEGG